MSGFRSLTVVEQLAGHLRRELLAGKPGGVMPGVLKLEADLGVNRKTVDAALRQLEAEGLLVPQGPGRRRLIHLPKRASQSSLRVAILLSEFADRKLDYMVALRHELAEAGHVAFHAPKSMVDFGMDAKRIIRMVKQTEADAWVVVSGSHEVLKWFETSGNPTFALFGRRRRLPMAGAGPDKPPAYAAAVRTLTGLGHRRIVLMARWRRRMPEPGASEQAFLDELVRQGITPSSYHLPDWEVSIEGFHERLASLFRVTPPTALIIDEVPFFVAAQQFLASKRLRVPKDVSLVCTDADPVFDWCRPSVAHIRWDSRPVVRRVVNWTTNVSRGKNDKRQSLTPAEFVHGGTIGTVKVE